MRAVLSTFIAVTLLSLSGPASAQDANRYRLERTESGFIRMDTRTGRMSFCEERSGQLDCKPAEDEQTADAGRLQEMSRRIDELERRLAALESRPRPDLPSEEEFEQTMSFMERFLRRFWGVAKDLERESGTEPAPDRT